MILEQEIDLETEKLLSLRMRGITEVEMQGQSPVDMIQEILVLIGAERKDHDLIYKKLKAHHRDQLIVTLKIEKELMIDTLDHRLGTSKEILIEVEIEEIQKTHRMMLEEMLNLEMKDETSL